MPQLLPFPRYYHLPPGEVTELPVTRHGIRQLSPFPFVATAGPTYAVLEVAAVQGEGIVVQGLCGLLPAELFTNGSVRPHEDTLAARLDRQQQLVRGDRGALGKPVLLTTAAPIALPPLLTTTGSEKDLVYTCGGYRYRLSPAVAIPDPLDLESLGTLVIADGHHRAYTHAALAAEGQADYGMIPVVIASGEQLRIGAFQWVIDQRRYGDLAALLTAFSPYFTATPLPAPIPVRQQGEWLLTYRGAYVHLERRTPEPTTTDPGWLIQVVLPAVFGITDLRTDPRIMSTEPPPLQDGVYQLDPMLGDRISLLGFPISHSQFFEEVTAGRVLPPKSTRFAPRIPSGLLVWIP